MLYAKMFHGYDKMKHEFAINKSQIFHEFSCKMKPFVILMNSINDLLVVHFSVGIYSYYG